MEVVLRTQFFLILRTELAESGIYLTIFLLAQEPGLCSDHLQTRKEDSETIVDKWNIAMYFNYTESSSRVRYIVCVTDNYYNPGRLIYKYSSMVWLPHFADTKLATPQGTIKVSDIQSGVPDPENKGATLSDYGTVIEYTAP